MKRWAKLAFPCWALTFAQARSGVAAVEFAFILPLMLLIYLGIVELSHALRAGTQLDLVAHSLADLTGQIAPSTSGSAAAITDTNIASIFAAGNALMAPFSATPLKMTISEVNIKQPTPGTYQAVVDWTVSSNGGTLRSGQGCASGILTAANSPPISLTTLPTNYTSAANSPAVGPIIVADVTYQYTPGLSLIQGLFGAGGMLLQRTAYASVRNTYTNTTYTYLYNHIQYSVTSATNGKNCIAPIL
jgi:Flp pilus assembly protein TadG